jgi:hypothetical protein
MKINKKSLTKSRIGMWISNQVNSNWFAKTVISISIWAIVFIPVYIYAAIRWLVDPVGFWQELAIVVVCGICLGWLQCVLLIFGFALTMMLIFDDL